MEAIPAVLVPIIGALTVAAVVEVIRQWFGRSNKRFDDQVVFRRELLERCQELEREVARLASQVDSWQQRYYVDLGRLQVRNTALQGEIGALMTRLAHYEVVLPGDALTPPKRASSPPAPELSNGNEPTGGTTGGQVD